MCFITHISVNYLKDIKCTKQHLFNLAHNDNPFNILHIEKFNFKILKRIFHKNFADANTMRMCPNCFIDNMDA